VSCGNPHETPCEEVLDHLYEYLDGEMPSELRVKFRQHFVECAPCLRQHGLEEVVKALVKRSCSEHAPEELRAKVLLKIRQVRVEVDIPPD
jgi:anti-sigma factor (TIGR02949 family)